MTNTQTPEPRGAERDTCRDCSGPLHDAHPVDRIAKLLNEDDAG